MERTFKKHGQFETISANAVYEQKDPLLIYKFESFNLFKSMLEKLIPRQFHSYLKLIPANKSPNLRNHNQTVSNKSFKASRIENSSLSNPNVIIFQ